MCFVHYSRNITEFYAKEIIMNFTTLLSQFTQKYTLIPVSTNCTLEITAISLIDSIHKPIDSHTLYLGYNNQLRSLATLPAHYIVAKNDDSEPTLQVTGNLAYTTASDLFTLFNEVRALLESAKASSFYDELITLANQSHSFEAILDTAAIKFGQSLIFADMNFKIISYSRTIPVIDPLWSANIQQGYCYYDFINAIKSLDTIQKAPQNTLPTEVTCERSPYRKLSCKVFHQKVQIGFLLLIEQTQTLSPTHYELLSTVSQVLSYIAAHYVPKLISQIDLYDQLIYDFLIETPIDQILSKSKTLKFPQYMTVLVLKPTSILGNNQLYNVVCDEFKQLIPSSHLACHKNTIVSLIPVKECATELKEDTDALVAFAQKWHLHMGISNSFSDLKTFMCHYNQANASLELATRFNPEETLNFYIEYTIFDLFSQLKSVDLLNRFAHPALHRLKTYDQKYKTQFYQTLSCYIFHGYSIKKASEALFIHRNSMIYRLNRIKEITKVDFEDEQTMFLLRISYLIDAYTTIET